MSNLSIIELWVSDLFWQHPATAPLMLVAIVFVAWLAAMIIAALCLAPLCLRQDRADRMRRVAVARSEEKWRF